MVLPMGHYDAATYADFIAAVSKHGYFTSDANCIVGTEDLGYSQSCGSELLDLLITEMAEDALDISEESAKVLQNGFASGFKEYGNGTISDSDGMEPMVTLCDNGSLVANRVMVDKDTAKRRIRVSSVRMVCRSK